MGLVGQQGLLPTKQDARLWAVQCRPVRRSGRLSGFKQNGQLLSRIGFVLDHRPHPGSISSARVRRWQCSLVRRCAVLPGLTQAACFGLPNAGRCSGSPLSSQFPPTAPQMLQPSRAACRQVACLCQSSDVGKKTACLCNARQVRARHLMHLCSWPLERPSAPTRSCRSITFFWRCPLHQPIIAASFMPLVRGGPRPCRLRRVSGSPNTLATTVIRL